MLKVSNLSVAMTCVLLLFARPTQGADKTLNAGGMYAKVLGQSGKIDLAPSKDISSDSNKMRVQIEALRELDAAGKELGKGGNSKHSFNSFATQDFTFGDLEDTTYADLDVIKIPFSSTLDAGSKISIDLYIFKEDGEITLGDEEFSVSNGTLKFNIKLTDWVWCGDQGVSCTNSDGVGASLEIDISVTSKDKPEFSSDSRVYTMGGGGTVHVSDQIQLDGGDWMEMDPAPSVDISGPLKITLKIPKFTTSALYDPEITYNSAGQWLGPSLILMALSLLLSARTLCSV